MIKIASPKKKVVVVKDSKIQGLGLWAKRDIPAFTYLIPPYACSVFMVVRTNDVGKSKAFQPFWTYASQVDRDYHIVDPEPAFDPKALDLMNFLNHGCDANCAPWGSFDFMTIRDVKKGEELTVDYSTIWTTTVGGGKARGMPCSCQSPNCRKKICSDDWKHHDWQLKVWPFVPPFLQARILMYLQVKQQWKQIKRLAKKADQLGISIVNL